MNFDVFIGIEFPAKYGGSKRLLDYCKEAERNIMINPLLSLDAARNALMTLCKGLLKINGVKQTLREDGQQREQYCAIYSHERSFWAS